MSDQDEARSTSLWARAGAYGAIGFEFTGFVLAGVLLGQFVDDRYGTGPWGLLGGLLLALTAAGVHIWQLVRAFISSDERDGSDA